MKSLYICPVCGKRHVCGETCPELDSLSNTIVMEALVKIDDLLCAVIGLESTDHLSVILLTAMRNILATVIAENT